MLIVSDNVEAHATIPYFTEIISIAKQCPVAVMANSTMDTPRAISDYAESISTALKQCATDAKFTGNCKLMRF